MKVKLNHEVETFTPVNLEITIESQEEMNVIHFLFYAIELCNLMEDYAGINPETIREKLIAKDQGVIRDMFNKLTNR